jgi:Uma2 family endonuclease
MIDLRLSYEDRQLEAPYLLKLYGFSEADFDRMAPESAFCELLDGTIIMPSPVGIGHQYLAQFLAELLAGYCRRGNLGSVLTGPAVMHLAPGRKFEPDVMVVLAQNAHRIGKKQISGPCDLVIEVLSESTRQYDLAEKAAAYRQGGVPETWFIDPDSRTVHVDLADQPRASFDAGRITALSLAGFWLDTAWLWQSPLPDPQECLAQIRGTSQ